MQRQPNTLDAHRLIRWAGGIGKAAEMKQRLMDLYFTEGADLTNRAVLVQAASDVGLDADDINEALASEQDVEQVSQEAQSAKEAGIDGVPCFIFGGRFAVSGAQAPEYLAEAIERTAQAAGRGRIAKRAHMKITAAVVRERGGAFGIEQLDLTDPRADELLVEVAASGMCATDLHGRDGYFPNMPFPAVFGHEGAGVVRAVGRAVSEFKPGDRVVMSYPWCGACPNCVSHRRTIACRCAR